jgi:hypothetical protein
LHRMLSCDTKAVFRVHKLALSQNVGNTLPNYESRHELPFSPDTATWKAGLLSGVDPPDEVVLTSPLEDAVSKPSTNT